MTRKANREQQQQHISRLNETLDAVMMFIENLQRKCNSIHLHRFVYARTCGCNDFALHSLRNEVNVDWFPTVI